MKFHLSTLVFILILLTVVGIVLFYTYRSPFLVSSEEAKKLIREKKIDVVLDVRTKLEYNLGHYPNALHIPTQLLNETVQGQIPNKDTAILVYCNTGQRSRYATDLLRGKGYTNVKYIAGAYWTLLR